MEKERWVSPETEVPPVLGKEEKYESIDMYRNISESIDFFIIMAAFVLKDISFRYPSKRKPVLQNINVTIDTGEFVHVLGTSGSGKSTLFKIINGLIPKIIPGEFSGKVSLFPSRNSKGHSNNNPVRIGMVFQNVEYQLLSNYVYEECPGNSTAENKFHDLLRLFSIYNLLNRRINLLSGGEKQKVALASVIASEPDILLLDEPETNLDNDGITTLCTVLKEMHTSGKTTIIIIENRLGALNAHFNKTYLASKGNLEEITNKSKTEYQISFQTNHKSLVVHSMPLVEVKNVSYSFGKNVLLDNISFSIQPGEIVGLTGPNGSGKSTLALMLLRLIKGTKGKILFNGSRIHRNKGRLSIIMQNPLRQVFCNTVREEVEFASKNFGGNSGDFVNQIVEILDLRKIQNEQVMTLSYGELERTVIAAALSHKPEFVVLDEPTIGQDNLSINRLFSLIIKLHEMKTGFLIISHYTSFLRQICHRVFELNNGRLIDVSNDA